MERIHETARGQVIENMVELVGIERLTDIEIK